MEESAIATLRLDIERMVGRPMRSPKDFDLLAELIYRRLHEVMSSMTLKRLWGYLTPVEPRESTLTVLARFLGYADWQAYLHRTGEPESGHILGRWLDVTTLEAGATVRLTWLPDRVCDVRYDGDCRFTVVDSRATRLKPGDTFGCMAMIEGEPLYLHDLRQADGHEPTAYVCGNRGGIRFECDASGVEESV